MNKLKFMFAMLAGFAAVRKLHAVLRLRRSDAAARRMAEGESKSPEQVMTEIECRAMHIGPIMQRILNDSTA